MKATLAKLVAPKKIELVEEELRPLEDDEVLIEIAACGICQSEMGIYDGTCIGAPGVSFRYKEFPANLGHEVSGIIVDKGGKVDDFDIGDRITGILYSGCGFATHIIEKADKLMKVPHKVPLEHALGEPIMCITNIIRLSQPDFGDCVYIIGSGFMSMLTVAALSKYPLKELIISGHYQERLDLARKYGATKTINAVEDDPWKAIMEITKKQGADIVIELSGKMAGLQLGASVCKPKQRAKLVMAGVYGEEPFTLGHYLQNRAPVLVVAYPNQSPDMMDDLRRGLHALESGLLPMDELVTHQFRLDQISEAMEASRTKKEGYIKGIIVPNPDLLSNPKV